MGQNVAVHKGHFQFVVFAIAEARRFHLRKKNTMALKMKNLAINLENEFW